jgi:hypothetical protein
MDCGNTFLGCSYLRIFQGIQRWEKWKMTDLNTAIANFKGKDGYDKHFSRYKELGWMKGAETIYENRPKDFEHDARLYMALFEEMESPTLYKSWNKKWVCVVNVLGVDGKPVQCESIGTAICLAYCKLNGLE